MIGVLINANKPKGALYRVYGIGRHKDYKRGYLMESYIRYDAYELKDLILHDKSFDQPINEEDDVEESLIQVSSKLNIEDDIVGCEMIKAEFLYALNLINEIDIDDSILESVFVDTPYNKLGNETYGQLLLSCLYVVIKRQTFIHDILKAVFEDNSVVAKEIENILVYMDPDHLTKQNILCKIINFDEKLEMCYLIQDAYSLVLYESMFF